MFVFFRLVLPESSQTKKNCAARGKFRLVENSLKGNDVTLQSDENIAIKMTLLYCLDSIAQEVTKAARTTYSTRFNPSIESEALKFVPSRMSHCACSLLMFWPVNTNEWYCICQRG